MDNKTLEALEGSIAKWEAIVGGTGVDGGGSNCPLCQLFYRGGHCHGCPVFDATDVDDCHNTPYYDFRNYSCGSNGCAHHNRRVVNGSCEEHRLRATAMLDLLKSLLPEPS